MIVTREGETGTYIVTLDIDEDINLSRVAADCDVIAAAMLNIIIRKGIRERIDQLE